MAVYSINSLHVVHCCHNILQKKVRLMFTAAAETSCKFVFFFKIHVLVCRYVRKLKKKPPISFVISACLSTGNNSIHTKADFHEIWYWVIFRKSVEKIQVSLISDKNKGYFTWRPMNIFGHISLSSFLEWEMFQRKAVEKIKTRILCSVNFFSPKIVPLWDNVEKYCRAGQATHDNMPHDMLDT